MLCGRTMPSLCRLAFLWLISFSFLCRLSDGFTRGISEKNRKILTTLHRDTSDPFTPRERHDDSLLIKYANKLGNRTVFKRLGYLLEVMNLGDAVLIEPAAWQ